MSWQWWWLQAVGRCRSIDTMLTTIFIIIKLPSKALNTRHLAAPHKVISFHFTTTTLHIVVKAIAIVLVVVPLLFSFLSVSNWLSLHTGRTQYRQLWLSVCETIRRRDTLKSTRMIKWPIYIYSSYVNIQSGLHINIFY